jgi:hypothetical protein
VETWFALLLLACAGAAFVGAYVASAGGGDLTRLALILFSPIVYLLAWAILGQLSVLDYDARCESECIGNLTLPLVLAFAWLGTEAGAFGGWFHAAVSRRRSSARG